MAREQDNAEHTVVGRRDPLVGQMFDGRFRIDARIAAGGFGAIYRATDSLGHELALKILHANLTTDPGVVARFRREGAALTLLRDPHTITAYELGEAADGTLYIVMELLHGESLYDRFRIHGPIPWRRVLAIARSVCSSLAEAHALGIIHRDLKPTNIHLEPRPGRDELVKVLDFGIAKILQDSDIDSSELTHAGQMIGTLDYMSPEQMVGGMCTAASDIYTLGIVMYEMIAGRRPFDDAVTPAAALAAALTMTPDRVAVRAIVTPEVDRLVMKCLERHHTDRFQSANELGAALDEILLDGDPIITRTSGPFPIVPPAVPPAAPAGAAHPRPNRPTPAPPTPGQSPVSARPNRPTPAPPTQAPMIATPMPARPNPPTPAPPMQTPLAAGPTPARPNPPTPAPLLQANAGPPSAPTGSSSRPVPEALASYDAPGDSAPLPFGKSSTLLGHTPAPVAQPTPIAQVLANAHAAVVNHTPVPVVPAPVVATPAPTPVATAAPVGRAPALTPTGGLSIAGAPQSAMPQLPAKNLRDVFPALARPTPSPMHLPPRAGFDELRGPITGITEPAAPRGRMVRRLALAVAVALAIVAALALVRPG